MKNNPRLLFDRLTDSDSRGKVRIILGARQTGKSTLLDMLSDERCFNVNLQQRATRREYERNPEHFTKQLEYSRDKYHRVCVDEIQKVPALLDEVQYLYDKYPGQFEFFLTGSSARKLKRSSANLLPGRSHLFHLCPLVGNEYAGAGNGILPFAFKSGFTGAFTNVSLEDRLLFGGLPGVIQESAVSRQRTLESYVDLYLEEEIRAEAMVRDLGAFQEFLELAAVESGKIINLSKLSQETRIPIATLKNYYQVLEDTFTGYRIGVYGAGGRKRVLTTPRFLFFDTGVRNAAARTGFTKASLRAQSGQLFENWVGVELIHRCLYMGRSHRVSSWRTAHHAEVDYVLETGSEAVPIEVKWTDNPKEADARHLKLFLRTYPDQARRGFLVCRCSKPFRLADNITAVPWSEI